MKEEVAKLSQLEIYANRLLETVVDYLPNLVAAIVMLFVGIWVIRITNKIIRKLMVKRGLEVTLIEFLSDIIYWGLRIVLFIAVISKLGVESSSFVAILGAAGLAIGLSLQGSLSNFAGGMLIIFFKPFRLGDFIEAQGVSGTVHDIQIFVTKLQTVNNQIIYLPNGSLSNGTIINFSQNETRRTSHSIALSFDTDIKQAREIIMNVLTNNPLVLTDPAPAVVVDRMSESAIFLAVRAWAKNSEFWEMSSTIIQDVKIAFDEKGITFQPYVRESSIKNKEKE
jgi:small conductance mechanosensitive channel